MGRYKSRPISEDDIKMNVDGFVWEGIGWML